MRRSCGVPAPRARGEFEQGRIENEGRAALDARTVGAPVPVAVRAGRGLGETLALAARAVEEQQLGGHGRLPSLSSAVVGQDGIPSDVRTNLAREAVYCHKARRTGVRRLTVMSGSRSVSDPLLVRAATGHPGSRPPVWFMRQAGRSLPEYRELRARTSMLEACRDPQLITEITLQPVRRHGVDAAILFSDIVVPLAAIGVGIDIVPGVGPVLDKPITEAADVDRLRTLEPDDVPYVTEAVRSLVGALGPTPLIGFAGAPFTLASYLVEGGPSREHARTKSLMHGRPELWHALLERLAAISREFMRVQIAAGAAAIQLFDSWAGSLSPADYAEYVLPHSRAVLEPLAGLVPRIHFGVGTGELLAAMRAAGADVVGVDWRVPLDEAARRLGPGAVVQGNLDPALLGAEWPVVEQAVRRVVAEGRAASGHIFNLGHGVPPDTDPDVLTRIVALVKSL
jgi:uroporphyrinogen decarboxylase